MKPDKITITQLKDGRYRVQFRALGEDAEGILDTLPAAIDAVQARYQRIIRRERAEWQRL